MNYQLVLQIPASSITDFDRLIMLEEAIIDGLGSTGDVDGHDAGSGEMNIFVLTDDPKLAFDRIKTIPDVGDHLLNMKVAFREVGKHEFTIIHPHDLKSFAIA